MGAGLDVDGIWGPLTEAAYNKYMGGGVNGTLNSYGEVKYGDKPTRGEVAREAQRAYAAGEITFQQYKTIIASVH